MLTATTPKATRAQREFVNGLGHPSIVLRLIADGHAAVQAASDPITRAAALIATEVAITEVEGAAAAEKIVDSVNWDIDQPSDPADLLEYESERSAA